MSMIVVDPVPMEVHMEELPRIPEIGRASQKEIASLAGICLKLIRPRAVYSSVKVMSLRNDEVLLSTGEVLHSIILADTLKPEQTIAPYVVTIGSGVEKRVLEEGRTSILRAWLLERIGDHALGKAAGYVRSQVEEMFGGRVSSFSPGTGTGKLFGIEQQKVIFGILDPPRNIGVELTSSYLMVPRKSVSGVFAAASQEYVACQYCPRERCLNRRRPFSGEYYSLRCDHEPER